jgi:ABC-type multidrug transport system ATPase subunit
MTAAIVCSELSFSWPAGVPVLSGLTASFGPGRTGLIGVNGSGKTTLLRGIAGLADLDGVTSGEERRSVTCRSGSTPSMTR